MTFADLHARCVVQQTFEVCGVELPPLRFGTVEALSITGLSHPMIWSELTSAVILSSQPPSTLPGLFAAIRSGARVRRIDKWIAKAQAEKRLEDECDAFKAFYRHWTEPPEAVRNKDRCDTRPAVMPFLQNLRSNLLAHLNYSPETLDEKPYARCLMDYYGWAETEGLVRVLSMSADERDALMAEPNDP